MVGICRNDHLIKMVETLSKLWIFRLDSSVVKEPADFAVMAKGSGSRSCPGSAGVQGDATTAMSRDPKMVVPFVACTPRRHSGKLRSASLQL